MDSSEVDRGIREVLGAEGRLYVDAATVREDHDLFRAGMTSLANVSVMLALEEKFGVEFPDHMLGRSTFQSLSSIRRTILEFLADQRCDAGGKQ